MKFETLLGVLGKPVDDPAVQAVIAKAGKVKKDSDFICAYDAGFDIALDQPAGAKRNAKKLCMTLFLFAEGADKHKAFKDLPKPFKFTADRESLIKNNKPDSAWNIDDGDIDVDNPNSERDTWNRDGYSIDANYGRKIPGVRHFTVQLPEEMTGGRDVATYPLHFESSPADAPEEAELVGMGLLLAWAADRFGLPAKHAGKKLDRETTPRTFLKKQCGSTLTTLDFDPKLADFLSGYTHRTHDTERKADAKIQKLLGLPGRDEKYFVDDFLGTFAVLDSPAYVPDSWAAVDRIAPVIDARWADYQETKLKTEPKLALYEKAVKLRDKISVAPAKATIEEIAVEDHLASELLALIDMPLSDKTVQALLTKLKLPIGKKIDEQANPALGISYLGTKIDVKGKRVMGIEEFTFFADKQKSHVRGMGKEVQFRGFTSVLPLGVTMGASRKAVAKAYGKPSSTYEDTDIWFPSKTRRIAATFKRDKLVRINFGKPADWNDPPEPPFGPKGVF